jgi:hypothetical protein
LTTDDPPAAAAQLAERGLAVRDAAPPEATIYGTRFLID